MKLEAWGLANQPASFGMGWSKKQDEVVPRSGDACPDLVSCNYCHQSRAEPLIKHSTSSFLLRAIIIQLVSSVVVQIPHSLLRHDREAA